MQSKKFNFLLFFIAIFFTSFSFIKTFRDVNQFGAIDLRDKIVGARLLTEGKSPYFYKWKNGDDERLLDPLDGFENKITRVAAAPSTLIFFVPLSKLSFGKIKWIWFAFSYLCLLFILFQFYSLASSENKIYVWILGLIFFLCAMAWQMHVERGQVYIFYTFILSSAYWCYRKEKYLLAGILLALLCSLRLPYFLLIPFLFFLQERRKVFFGFISSAIFLCLLTFLFTSVQNWRDYFSSMQEWSRFEIHEMTTIPNAVKQEIPSVIEGQTNLGTMYDFWQNNRTVQCVAFQFLNVKLYAVQLLGMFAFVLAALGSFIFLQWKKNKFILNDNKVFIFIFLIYILAEYFSPAPSYSYHYVQWIFPVLLLVASEKKLNVNISSILILLGLSMNLGIMSILPYNLAIGEVILFIGVFMHALRY